MREINPSLREKILDVAQRERETDVHHNRWTDDLGGMF